MRGTHRQRIALLACLTWLLAIVGLPALHEARHAADHTHGSDGAIHQHDPRGRHVAPPKRDHHRSQQLAIDHPVEPGHQAGGVAHHAVAVVEAVPPALPPISRRVTEAAPVARASIAISIPTRPSARGPPSPA